MATSSDPPPISVLFICLGNICRSPMAEAVLQSLTTASPFYSSRLTHIDSAGTGAYHTDSPPDSRTMDTLRRHGIMDYDHGARQVEEEDFRKFDYIFAMDSDNLRSLERMKKRLEGKATKRGEAEAEAEAASQVNAKVMLFGEFHGRKADGKKNRAAEEVGDPYYGAENGFEKVYQQVARFSKNFLEEVVGLEVDGKGKIPTSG